MIDPLPIKKAEFVSCFVDMKSLPDNQLPEIALVGRSNVGKSSLINKIVNRKNLAKSSSTPGKTRTINYYCINDSWYMVDLPGYGFAKVSKTEKEKWGRMIEKYLSGREPLRGVIQLLDIRHPPTQNDILMKEWLNHYQMPILLVATKADKVSRNEKQKNLAVIKKTFNLSPEQPLITFSAVTGEGVEEVKAAIEEILAE
ncbi:GTP-binding protein, ribosome biogenesis, YsxC [Syntrophomonas zehnderi OL-4]|uniref:Probable GTP-binding protein EngB n=1 Tax=Syntrophomonas zehnderi OL-4 TaxID=690567 RepID=A0A0E3W3G8_9FIRM|nr:ribosome biogenesis GTP-binding protein YihA/YsxC [Syntrophomonas zehnderi]CFX81612.1 GTP-binding protein, ribosome biogenesis, YsxC [Syntrophomonas zehnderi OL-4]